MLSGASRYRSHWPDEHTERLRALWSEGWSASTIARFLNGEFHDASYSRNAVIGRAYRIGLAARKEMSWRRTQDAKTVMVPKQPKAKRQKRAYRKRQPKEPAMKGAPLPEEVVCPDAKMLSIMELNDHTCRWPIGDPKEPGFGFCGASKEVDGTPYCSFHNQMARGVARASGWNDERRFAQRRRHAEKGIRWGFHGAEKVGESA